MKELELEELKTIELDILRVFHSFCTENNIQYFLAYGTLLGAIRYKKFIPWDDDVDVIVPRKDYDKLISIFQDSEKYRLYAFERDRNYRYPFAKLCDMRTRLIETVYPDNGVELGVNIDIFPLDTWDNNLHKAKKEVRRINKNATLLGFTKRGKPLADKLMKRLVWRCVFAYCKMRGSGHYIQKIIKECNKPDQKTSRYVGVKVWPIYNERGIIPATAFAETVEIEFEGEMFPAPVGFDTYLRCLYGDYMPEPPMEKRRSHHTFTAYRL